MNFDPYDIIPSIRYQDNNILELAEFFLGKIIVSNVGNTRTIARIVETEAYRAPDDKGSHAFGNKKTERTKTMFQAGGVSYVYLCYGLHNMLNIVSGDINEAHAILIRAVEPLEGLETMTVRRQGVSNYNLTNGPGKLCQALGITRDQNSVRLYTKDSPIYILKGVDIPESEIIRSPRVGISYAQECAHWPWRFRIKNNPWTSKPETVRYD
ncbi:MAG: DNA-3-methyladenine glycosylase [Saprospiraceae bacterium]|nr:DNA-3-methyladenine glycosylase [Saprospiraceae bacterium]